MSSAGGEDLTVTSWGWTDEDGSPVLAGDATFRLWRVRKEGDLVGLIAAPVDLGAVDVLILAANGWTLG